MTLTETPPDSAAADRDGSDMDPRIKQRREEVARARTRRRFGAIGAVGAVLVVCAGAWTVLHSPVLSVRHVTVVGAVHTPMSAVLATAAVSERPLVDVNTGAVARRLETLPWVARARVSRHWPDSLTVVVSERRAAAVVESPGHGDVVVDGAGRVLASVWAPAPAAVVLQSPAVPGRPGTVLGAAARPGLQVLRAVPSLLRRRVERIVVGADGDVSLALTGNVGVTLGPAVELPAKFEALVSVLVDVPPSAPEDVDVTVPDDPSTGPPPPPPGARRGPAPGPTVGSGPGAGARGPGRRGPR